VLAIGKANAARTNWVFDATTAWADARQTLVVAPELPSAPVLGNSALTNNGAFSLSWKACAGVTGYEVWGRTVITQPFTRWAAGTDPKNALDLFLMAGCRKVPEGVAADFPTAAGHDYTVYFALELADRDTVWNLFDEMVGTGDLMSVTNPWPDPQAISSFLSCRLDTQRGRAG